MAGTRRRRRHRHYCHCRPLFVAGSYQ
jgi:hypothetical protein